MCAIFQFIFRVWVYINTFVKDYDTQSTKDIKIENEELFLIIESGEDSCHNNNRRSIPLL